MSTLAFGYDSFGSYLYYDVQFLQLARYCFVAHACFCYDTSTPCRSDAVPRTIFTRQPLSRLRAIEGPSDYAKRAYNDASYDTLS